MTAHLTERMQAWIETGCQLAVASQDGEPAVVIVPSPVVRGDEVAFPLREGAFDVLAGTFSPDRQVAFGVSGKMRAPYQFKGTGRIETEGEAVEAVAAGHQGVLFVTVEEIYSTKPGSEAGKRLDIMPVEELQEWEADRWTDMPDQG